MLQVELTGWHLSSRLQGLICEPDHNCILFLPDSAHPTSPYNQKVREVESMPSTGGDRQSFWLDTGRLLTRFHFLSPITNLTMARKLMLLRLLLSEAGYPSGLKQHLVNSAIPRDIPVAAQSYLAAGEFGQNYYSLPTWEVLWEIRTHFKMFW
jgi:hypothetical protein